MMISKLDKTIISVMSADIPLVSRPFQGIAASLGINEATLLSRLKAYRKKGWLRKFSAVVNHRKIGFQYNAMVVWNIPDQAVNQAGKAMSEFSRVSHCYQRKKSVGWNYNLYTMIHGKAKKECFNVVRAIARKTSCRNYKVLFSSQEYKKTAVDFAEHALTKS